MKPERIDIEQARRASGLRIVTLAHVPSPWGEALKGILHIKQLPHARVGHVFGSPTTTLQEWSGQDSFPVMAWNDERPLSTWIDQLNLAERLAPTPRLIPERLEDRVLMFGYCNELCGENGIGWTERLRGVHEEVSKPGDPAGVSAYLGKKYGYTPEIGTRADRASRVGYRRARRRLRAAEVPRQPILHRRLALGDGHLLGSVLQCDETARARAMPDASEDSRDVHDRPNPPSSPRLKPILIEHRDFIFKNYLELPVDLS